MRDLDGCVVVVTGANSGIGQEFLRAVPDGGATKVYAAVRDPAQCSAWQAEFGARVVLLPLDLEDRASMDAAAAAAGDADLLMSNAGRTRIAPFMTCTEAEMRHLLEVNFFGPMRLMRGMAPALAARRGGIICVTSMAALMPALSAEAYSASKAAMMMGAHGLRNALRDDGLRLSIVYPGFVDTPMAKSFEVRKASPRQIADRSLDGWRAGETAIFPALFAEMTRDALMEQMPRVLNEPRDLLLSMVAAFVAHPDAGT